VVGGESQSQLPFEDSFGRAGGPRGSQHGQNIKILCVKPKTCQLARIGITKVIEAWNAHRIPGNTK
ncbi:hypothetical protein FQN60_003406, partial [Etheostoma spectabile]